MKIKFEKYADGLVPAVIQDAGTGKVLMLGFMNAAAFDETSRAGRVTFFSRSRSRLWTKGEESGNYLFVKKILLDCDQDSLLIKVKPAGPVCHTGADTCWNENHTPVDFLQQLEEIIATRKNDPAESSYTSSLFNKGINKIAQKLGEEAVELVIEAKDDNAELFKAEAADLLFHYLVLLQAKGFRLADVTALLADRHRNKI
jgi:phosphoribosyl-AMP cyclohydrolase / phosphoribosyl-ATP pyrophosphohydrolase